MDKFFEIGHVWQPTEESLSCEGDIADLLESIAVAWICGAEPLEKDWHRPAAPDFYAVKSLAGQLAGLAQITLRDGDFASIGSDSFWNSDWNHGLWQNGYGAQMGHLEHDGYELCLGLLSPRVTASFGIPVPAYCGELRLLPDLFSSGAKQPQFAPFTNFPPAVRDLALSVDAAVAAEEVRTTVERCIWQQLPPATTLYALRIFDIYEGESLGPDRKSIALRFTFGRSDRTLKDGEIAGIFEALLRQLEGLDSLSIRCQGPAQCGGGRSCAAPRLNDSSASGFS
jgi:phenylalanyl-tRNA synthetase beta chain